MIPDMIKARGKKKQLDKQEEEALTEIQRALLHNNQVETPDDIDLNVLFLAVCKTPENMNTMLESMNQVMQEMVE